MTAASLSQQPQQEAVASVLPDTARTLSENKPEAVASELGGRSLIKAPVRDRSEYFRRQLDTAQDNAAFNEWLQSEPNLNRKLMIERMKTKKTPEWSPY